MKTIGLIGGMSWESSAEYYRLVNEETRRHLGGMHSARIVPYSFDFADIDELPQAGAWERASGLLAEAARVLERAGAELLVLCTNTMHRLFDDIEAGVSVPFIHIADPTAEGVRAEGLGTLGLLGTRYTMEGDFSLRRLKERHGLSSLIPDEPDRSMVHDIIYGELVVGVIRDESRQRYRKAIVDLVARGAQAIVLGCPEIGLLIDSHDAPVPVFDSTRLHAQAAVAAALTMP